MDYPTDTPLADITKYVQEATKGPGLCRTGFPSTSIPSDCRTLTSQCPTPWTLVLADTPLKHTLRLLLRQLSLLYTVKDGLLVITSTASDDQVTPFSIMEEKAARGELTREQYKQLIEVLKLKREVEVATSYRDGDSGRNNGGGGMQ